MTTTTTTTTATAHPTAADALAAIDCALAMPWPRLHLISHGSGGAGVMIARRIAWRLPPLSDTEARTVRLIRGALGLTWERPAERPLRAPHHTVNAPALRAEVALAHAGVLLFDALAEFSPLAWRAGHYTLVDGEALISGTAATLPARPAAVVALSQIRKTDTRIVRQRRADRTEGWTTIDVTAVTAADVNRWHPSAR